jgi:hypothetical protein
MTFLFFSIYLGIMRIFSHQPTSHTDLPDLFTPSSVASAKFHQPRIQPTSWQTRQLVAAFCPQHFLNRTTEDSYTSSLAVESFPFGLSVAQRSRRLPDPLVACSSTSPLARLRSERTAGVFSRSFILYQCPVV